MLNLKISKFGFLFNRLVLDLFGQDLEFVLLLVFGQVRALPFGVTHGSADVAATPLRVQSLFIFWTLPDNVALGAAEEAGGKG